MGFLKKTPLFSKRSAKKTGGPRMLKFFVKVLVGTLHVEKNFEIFWGLFKNFRGLKGVPEKVSSPEILFGMEFLGNKNWRKFSRIGNIFRKFLGRSQVRGESHKKALLHELVEKGLKSREMALKMGEKMLPPGLGAMSV